MELTSPDNLCGQTLLRLSASGASIVAELLRLSHNIPEVRPTSISGALLTPCRCSMSQAKKDNVMLLYDQLFINETMIPFLQVLIDFAYLKDQENFERKLNASTDLLDLDQVQ